MAFFLLFSQCFAESKEITVKPLLTKDNINSFFVQILELNIPEKYKVESVRLKAEFTNTYRPFIVYTYNSNARQRSYDNTTKLYVFQNINSGKHTFRIKTDWEYDDVIKITLVGDFQSNSENIQEDVFTSNETNDINPIKLLFFFVAAVSLIILFIFLPSLVSFMSLFFLSVTLLIWIYPLNYCPTIVVSIENPKLSINALMYPIEKPDDWATFDQSALKSALDAELDFSQCKLCNIQPAKPPMKGGSTKRDAIFVFAYDQSPDYLSLISARTAGFKGKFFIFSTNQIPRRLEKCGAFHIPIRSSMHYYYSHHNIRFPVIYQVLDKFGSYFNRIIYCDHADTFFQADPFNFDDNAFQISDENIPMFTDEWVAKWVPELPGLWLKYFEHSGNVTCSGLFGGYVEPVYKLTRIVASFWRQGETAVPDQAIYDFVLESGIPKKIGLDVKINQDLQTRGYELYRRQYDQFWPINPLGKFYDTRTNYYPAAIHQTNRRKEIHEKFRSQCN